MACWPVGLFLAESNTKGPKGPEISTPVPWFTEGCPLGMTVSSMEPPNHTPKKGGDPSYKLVYKAFFCT